MWPDLPKQVLYTRTVYRHTFYRQLLATSMYQLHMCLILLKIEQSTFTQASFYLSDVYECSGGLQMAPSSLGKQTADCESPHNWLMSLSMHLAALCRKLCDMWMWKWHQWKLFGCFQWRRRLYPPLHVSPTAPHPIYRSASGMGYASKSI